eukprot:6919727-Lingulodinium_polyedra.AAC.1
MRSRWGGCADTYPHSSADVWDHAGLGTSVGFVLPPPLPLAFAQACGRVDAHSFFVCTVSCRPLHSQACLPLHDTIGKS